MTKSELINLFPDISPTAIQIGQDGAEIRGKWAVITPMDGIWDVWLYNPKDPSKGLSARKITNMLRSMESTDKTDLTVLDGEAWFRVSDHRVISEIRHIIGVRKKRRVSDAALANLKKGSF
jgi:hypothetical protein